jgi:hypothetical protein
VGSTPTRGYVYPDSTSDTQIWTHFETLADDIDADVDGVIARPIVRLIQMSAQGFTSSSAAALTFGASSEDADSHNYHDTVTNNSRVTPTKAGWYTCRVTASFGTPSSAFTQIAVAPAKNGTRVDGQVVSRPDAANIAGAGAQSTALIYCNGIGDYVEGYVQQNSSGSQNTNTTATLRSTFEVLFERP